MGDSVYSDDNTIILRGDFALGTDYTVTVAGETPATEPFTLGQPVSRKVSFAPVPSRLYFQGFAAQQQRAGSRQFGLMSVNVSKLRVTAKVVPADSVIGSIRRVCEIQRATSTKDDESYQKVDEATRSRHRRVAEGFRVGRAGG